MEREILVKQSVNILEQNIARLVAEKVDSRVWGSECPHELPLGNLGLNAIQLCDLTVNLEDVYEISIEEEPELMASWSITELTRCVKAKLLQKSARKPNWKDSFEGLVFSGQVKALRTPLEVHLDLTFRCNMRCIFCYDSSEQNRDTNEITTAAAQRIIDECHALDVVSITYGGGEPFIRKDFMDIVRYSKGYGIRVAILTNGTCITSEIAQDLAECLDLRFDLIQVSLDGPNSSIHDKQRGVSGAFEQTMQGIRHLQAVGIIPAINSVLTRYNSTCIPEMIPFLMEQGLNSYRVLRLHPLGRAQDSRFYNQWKISNPESEALSDFLEAKRRELVGQFGIADDNACIFPWSAASYRNTLLPLPGKEPVSYACGAGTTRISIAADGSVYPCSYLYEFPELKVGSLRESSIKDLWENEALWTMYREPLVPSGKCRKCAYLFYCKTGCRALSYAFYGDMGAPDAGCAYEPEAEFPEVLTEVCV